MSDQKHVLIATLGGQPQIVTFTLDLLLKNYPISEVHLIHPRPTDHRLQHSLDRLHSEFINDHYQFESDERIIHVRSCVLQLGEQQLEDISDDRHADGTLDTIHQLTTSLKRQGYTIHLSVTGGRRMIALLATSVAALNFDRHDHIWHLYTPKEIQAQAQEGAIMHVPAEAGVRLINGPFIHLGAFIHAPESFHAAQQEQINQMDMQEQAACQQVWNIATPKQRSVLQALSRGLRAREIAEELCISIATVNSHKMAISQYCRNAWNLQNNDRADYLFIYQKFSNFFPKRDLE